MPLGVGRGSRPGDGRPRCMAFPGFNEPVPNRCETFGLRSAEFEMTVGGHGRVHPETPAIAVGGPTAAPVKSNSATADCVRNDCPPLFATTLSSLRVLFIHRICM